MKPKVFPFLLLLLGSRQVSQAYAICGCFMGITLYDNQSGFSLMHRYRIFNGYPLLGQAAQFRPNGANVFVPSALNSDNGYAHSHRKEPTDFEAFRAVELRDKYFLSQRAELNAFVPYVRNSSQINGLRLNSSGLGDATVFAGYLIRAIETAGVQSRLIMGGVKLPTGDFPRVNAQGRRHPLLNQVGIGTTDGFVYTNHIASYRGLGLGVNGSYRVAHENALRNSLTPSTAAYGSLPYRVPLGDKWQGYPSAQAFYEKTNRETPEAQLTGEHAMNNAPLGPGLNVCYQCVSPNASVQLPVYAMATDHPARAARLGLAVGYSFKQTRCLLHRKG